MEQSGFLDFLIVGAGMYGATCARMLTDKGYRCKVIEKRGVCAGNCMTQTVNGIDVHMYGPHIFHTDNNRVWEYVSRFADFNNFRLNTLAMYGKRLYHLPFNMTTLSEMYLAVQPAPNILMECVQNSINAYINRTKESPVLWKNVNGELIPNCLESYAVSKVGELVYSRLIKGYTEKQWGKSCQELPADLIKRLPIRDYFDNNYFNDKYQGIPVEGYTKMVENMLTGISVEYNTDFDECPGIYCGQAKTVIYTGAPDGLMNYELGPLGWRSLQFEHNMHDEANVQGAAVINYTSEHEPYTRTIEHRWFTPERNITGKSIVTTETPKDWEIGEEKYYSVNNMQTDEQYGKYVDAIYAKYPNIVLGGRLGLYKYLDMDDTILAALEWCDTFPYCL